MSQYRPLSQAEIDLLEKAGCRAAAWSDIQVKEGFDPRRVHHVHFAGPVQIGALQGAISLEGAELPAEIADATLSNCQLGDNVRVTGIGSHLANYIIGDNAVVTDIGLLATRPGSTFGNGIEVEAVNEGGGREVPIFNEISSQFAHLFAFYRHRPALIEGLKAMV